MVQSFPQIEPNEGHIEVEPAFAFEPADGLDEAWKPKVEAGVGGKEMDDLDLVGTHSCRPAGMVVEALAGRRDHDILEPAAVLENEVGSS